MSTSIQQSYHSFVATVFENLQDLWLEAIIITAALQFYYFAHAQCGVFPIKEKHQSHKYVEGSCRSSATVRPVGKKLKGALSSKGCKQSESEEAHKVRKFVGSLLLHGSHGTTEALAQYDEIVKGRCLNLRQEVADDQHARSMYIALIGRALSIASEGLAAWSGSESVPATRGCILRFLKDMREFGFPRTVEFYSSLQKLLFKNQLFQDALWLYDEMVDDGIMPNTHMYIGFMNIAISCGQPSRAVFFFNESSKLGPPTMRTYMTVFRVHAQKSDWKAATKLLDQMEAYGTRPDNLFLNNILGLCISVGQIAVAERVLHHWRDIIDVVSCNILLKGYTQQADLAKAEEILDRMGLELPAPNIITFNTVMDCAVRTLQCVMNSTAKCGSAVSVDTKRLASLFETEVAGFSGLSSCAIARRPWHLLDRLLKLGLTPDRYTCSTLVKGMHLAGCSVSDIDRIMGLLRSIGPCTLPSTGAGKSTSQAGSSQGSNDRLFEVLFNTLLDGCIKVHDLDRMAQIFEMMQEFRTSVSAVTFGTLIKAFGQAGRLSRCKEVWKEMQQTGIKPTIVTYGCYIDACIRNEDFAAAEEMFESMLVARTRPNAVVFNSMIRGFANSGQLGKALEYFEMMQDAGIQSPSVTLDSVMNQATQSTRRAACRAGSYSKAMV